MVSPLEMYSKLAWQIGFAWTNGENWSENGQWLTVISSSEFIWYRLNAALHLHMGKSILLVKLSNLHSKGVLLLKVQVRICSHDYAQVLKAAIYSCVTLILWVAFL